MITRRRRQGSESEHQNPLIEVQSDGSNVLKGPSPVFQWAENYNQPLIPLYFVGPSTESFTDIQNPVSSFKKPIKESLKSDLEPVGDDMASLAINMPSVTNASRDRTVEFMSAVRSLQSRNSNGMVLSSNHTNNSRYGENSHHTEFMRVAKIISKDLSNTYAKLEKLTLLAKKKSLFDDRPQEIQELTYIIREDITNLNKQIAQLQEFTRKQQNQQQNTKAHSTNIVVALQSKLATMSSEFKQVLEVRTENLKAQRSRRQQFTGNPVVSDLPADALTGGPLGSQSNMKGSVLLHDEYEAQRADAVSIDMGGGNGLQGQSMLFADETDTYLQSRSDAVQSIESTIVELGGIFQQLALMVREQEEMVQRIDANVDDAHLNVEAAHDELLRYFRNISSNRWLMMKIFGVVIVFVLIFVIFFA